MSSVPIDVPGATLVTLKLDATQAAAQLRMAAAMKLFELGRLSSGAAVASPLLYLHQPGCIEILGALYSTVLVAGQR